MAAECLMFLVTVQTLLIRNKCKPLGLALCSNYPRAKRIISYVCSHGSRSLRQSHHLTLKTQKQRVLQQLPLGNSSVVLAVSSKITPEKSPRGIMPVAGTVSLRAVQHAVTMVCLMGGVCVDGCSSLCPLQQCREEYYKKDVLLQRSVGPHNTQHLCKSWLGFLCPSALQIHAKAVTA